jgi:predicted nucleic acid-binding protein
VTVFADSSAVVKLYADEDGSEIVRQLEEPLVVSALVRVEVPAAIWRKHRIGELDVTDAGVLSTSFEADWFTALDDDPRFLAVGANPRLLDDAARLVATHGLRAYDGVQLATALAARGADPACRTVAAFDNELRRSAAAEGFDLAPG